jgi:hypothetical protein
MGLFVFHALVIYVDRTDMKTRMRLGFGFITDLIPVAGGPGAAILNFFFFYLALRRVGLRTWTSVRILGWKLLKDAGLT